MKEIFQKEIEEIMTDDDLTALLKVLDPGEGATFLGRGDHTAHSYLIKKAKRYTHNWFLIIILQLISKDQLPTKMVEEAAD